MDLIWKVAYLVTFLLSDSVKNPISIDCHELKGFANSLNNNVRCIEARRDQALKKILLTE